MIDVAIARFEVHQTLKQELVEVTRKLSDRKLIDRAKGILMKTRGLDEDAAYVALRRLAMDRNSHAAVQHEVSSARRVYGHHDTTTSAENERCVNQAKEASSGTTNKGEKVSNRKRSNDCGA